MVATLGDYSNGVVVQSIGGGGGNGGSAASGTVNTGSGGGGGTSGSNGSGGSGVVILRTTNIASNLNGTTSENYSIGQTVSGCVTSADGDYNIYKFTGSGSITF